MARQIARFQKYLVTWFTFSEVSHKYLQLRVMSKYHMCYFSPIMHCKKFRGRVTRVTNQKVALSPPGHTFSVSSGNVLVAFGSAW